MTHPKRLIEVDLPIARISAHARREKSIRHGHISTLHIWWARRPLAACRAVICAALWPDPADPNCPHSFRQAAARLIKAFAKRFFPERITDEKHHLHKTASADNLGRWEALAADTLTLDPEEPADWGILRFCLLDFIADFANWDNSTVPAYLETSRALTQAAHEALGGEPGTRPLVVDPFAGGGSIPLEALRVGADAFASDLNPVAVLLNKVVLEYIPKYGQKLADEVRKWGQWIKEQAEKELAEFYPKDPDGATPIAYLWARTIRCESPACGAVIPLMNQVVISKRRQVSINFETERNVVKTNIVSERSPPGGAKGTVQNGSVTCPACGYTMPAKRYRQRSADGNLGEVHYCTILACPDGSRRYRNPAQRDRQGFELARARLKSLTTGNGDVTVPDELLSSTEPRRLNVLQYGFRTWGALFNERQLVLWLSFSRLLGRTFDEIRGQQSNADFAQAISTVLGLSMSHLLQYNCNMSTWITATCQLGCPTA
jgi:adenine-specific DNA methylase